MPNPFSRFELWFQEALKIDTPEPAAMTLSTVDHKHRPSSRVVLLKEWNASGFVFYTNTKSRKGEDLAKNPFASLLFYWDSLGKQIRVEGRVEKVSIETSLSYFKSRPIESRWGAWASKQSQKLAVRSELEERFRQVELKYPNEVPLPEFWSGYCLRPQYFEFWQAGAHRLHQRTIYEKAEGNWLVSFLIPTVPTKLC